MIIIIVREYVPPDGVGANFKSALCTFSGMRYYFLPCPALPKVLCFAFIGESSRAWKEKGFKRPQGLDSLPAFGFPGTVSR